MSPVDHREDIAGIAPYNVATTAGVKNQTTKLRGAVVTFRAVPGMTAEWLQRVVQNDIALGSCDFGDPRATVDVTSAGGGFWVRITASSNGDADQILHKAQLMAAPAR